MSFGLVTRDAEFSNLRVQEILTTENLVSQSVIATAVTLTNSNINFSGSDGRRSNGAMGISGASGESGAKGQTGATGAGPNTNHPVIPVSSDLTLTASDSGAFLLVTPGVVAITITLPPVAGTLGVKYNISCTATGNSDIFIQLGGTDANLFFGSAFQPAGILPAIQVAGGTSLLRFNGTQAVAGDFFQIQSTGERWQVSGVGQHANSLSI